ncbi:MAG: IclR family transcriptional regulator [Burkholderiales bacterium]
MMRGVGRTMAVFDCFSEDRPSLNLQSIANRVGLPKSTTFRLVQSLEQAGYLVRQENQEYCLSHKLVQLARLVGISSDVRRVARSVLEEAAKASGETVILNAARGRERVCLEVIDTQSPLASIAKPGQHVPLVDGATAKLLLAYLPGSAFKEAVGYASKVSGQPRSQLLSELEQVRSAGYAVTHGERIVGVSAVAAPVRDTDDVTYCIAIAGPTARMKPRLSEHIRIATRAGEEVSRRLGARASHGAAAV